MFDALCDDLRYAVRGLRRAPGFTLTVILTLALGTGVNVAIFSIVDHTLLRPLRVPSPRELVNLSSPGPKAGSTSANSEFGETADVFSYPLFRDLERLQTVFTGIAAHRDFEANTTFNGTSSHVAGLLVSGSYFPVLAVQPALGRLLGPDDDRAVGAQNVTVLSYDYWRTTFNADPSVLNQALVVNGWPMTVVGVAPSSFVSTTLEQSPDLFVPLTAAGLMRPDWNGFDNRRDHWLYLFGRLKKQIASDAAERAINVPFAGLIKDVELPAQRAGLGAAAREEFARRRLRFEPGAQGQRPNRDELDRLALLLFCGTVSVLLMACANVANLLLARSIYRQPELTVRMSIGAGRGRLVRQMLIESALLTVAGGSVGVMLAVWTLGALTPLFPGGATFQFELNSALFTFAMLVSGLTVLLIGLYPALYGTRPNLAAWLRGSTTSSGSSGAAHVRKVLTAMQMALSFTLIVFAGLFTQSFSNVMRVELGIRTENLLTFRIRPELSGYTRDRARLLAQRIERELATRPAVASVSTSTIPLLAGFGWASNVTVERSSEVQASPHTADVGPGYFRTVGIPIIRGREFVESDNERSQKVAIVNESFVRTFKLGDDVLGRRMGLGNGDIPLDIEIVGVVGDARYSHIKEPVPPQFYLPYHQVQRFGAVNFYLRSTGPREPQLAMVRQLMGQVDRAVPVEDLRTMDDQVRADSQSDRSLTILSASFALLAILLASVGLYGVLSYSVAQRRKEVGVRMALGANTWRITRLVFGDAMRVTFAGGLVGCAAALGLGTLARSMLFGVERTGPGIVAGAAVIVTSVAVMATVIPAVRATRIDPAVALRAE